MNNKPQPKTAVVITDTSAEDRIIRFDATPEIADRIRADELGSFIADESTAPSYTLKVSAIYGFDEVIDYLQKMAA